ncbi:MAG: hypothetical protein KF822_11415 [Steroidobacteraceae bacterium]|nr:hypothetical protein [Steroidobacteraceae bacterium]
MPADRDRAVSHDGDIVRIQGRPVRMQFMVRDAFWTGDRAVVLLDPSAYLDDPTFGAQRRRSRDPIHNLRAYAPSGQMLWQAEQPEFEDHYYRIESREPLVALSFSGHRCDLDLASGKILRKTRLK